VRWLLHSRYQDIFSEFLISKKSFSVLSSSEGLQIPHFVDCSLCDRDDE